ncbi:hypothetical protein GGR58DRAFT_455827 [Xylaria digitata]|nr:hypothetical protein GGR58DRAFT_455827 [Xylaria digitata]
MRRNAPIDTLAHHAKMAPVWADRESASCGLNTLKHASGYSDETLCLFCSIVLASQACNMHALSCHTLKTLFTKQYRALLSAPRLSGAWGGSLSPDPPIGHLHPSRVA